MQAVDQISVYYSAPHKAYYVKHCLLGQQGCFGERFTDQYDAVAYAHDLSTEKETELGVCLHGFSISPPPSPPTMRVPTPSPTRSPARSSPSPSSQKLAELRSVKRQLMITRARTSSVPLPAPISTA
jgi:hypothetical protein